MPRPHRLPGAALDLVEVYLGEFTQAGFLAVSSAEDGARAFCARFGSIAGWAAAPLNAQVGADERVRRFVAWLALTARMPVSADYLIARRPRLGPIMAAYHPAAAAIFAESASRAWLRGQEQRAAVGGPRAGLRVARRRTGRGHPPLLDTTARRARRRRRPARGRPARQPAGDLFGLQATLFHAGLSDEPPRPRTRRSGPRADSWEQVPAVLAETLTGYLDQLRVTRRPGTVANEDEALREFAVLPRPPPPRRRFGGRGGPRPRRGLQALARRAARPPRRSAAPAHRASPVELGAAVLPAAHRVGRHRRPGQGAGASPRPADQGRPAAPVPRRCRRDEAAASPPAPTPTRWSVSSSSSSPAPACARASSSTSPSTPSCRSAPPTGCGPGRQTAQRPLHPPAPAAQTAPRRWLATRPEDLRSKLMFIEQGAR